MNPTSVADDASSRPSNLNDTHRLSGNMGVFQLSFTVLAYNAPAVAFLAYLPAMVLLGNGIGTPAAILFCTVVVGLLAAGIVSVATSLDKPGGFYAIITAGLGREVGLGSGYAALMCYFSAMLGGYAIAGIGVSALVRDVFHGPEVAWWLYTLVLFVLASVLGYFNIEVSAKVLSVFLLAEVALIVVYDVGVIGHLGLGAFNLHSFEPTNVWSGSIGIALLFGAGLFGGFEATVIFRDEVRSPLKTIKRATYLVVGLIGGVYALTTWLFINSYGAEAIMAAVADPTGAARTSVEKYAGEFAYDAATILLVTSAFALIISGHNICARYAFNLSSDGILPGGLAAVHPRHNSPHRASITVSLTALAGIALVILVKSDPTLLYARLAGVYGYTALILFILVAMAVVAYLMRSTSGASSTSAKVRAFGCTLSGCLMLYALWVGTDRFDLLTGATGVAAWIMLGVVWGLIVLGVVTAVVYRRTRPQTYARIGRQEP